MKCDNPVLKKIIFDTSSSDVSLIDGLTIECIMLRNYLNSKHLDVNYLDLVSRLEIELKESKVLIKKLEEDFAILEAFLGEEHTDSDVKIIIEAQYKILKDIKGTHTKSICEIRNGILEEINSVLSMSN